MENTHQEHKQVSADQLPGIRATAFALRLAGLTAGQQSLRVCVGLCLALRAPQSQCPSRWGMSPSGTGQSAGPPSALSQDAPAQATSKILPRRPQPRERTPPQGAPAEGKWVLLCDRHASSLLRHFFSVLSFVS